MQDRSEVPGICRCLSPVSSGQSETGNAVHSPRAGRAQRPCAVRKGKDCMSTNPIRPSAAAAAAPPPDGTPDPTTTPTPTITHYQQLADDFSKALDQIASIIPKLEIAHPATANFVRSHL